VFLHAGKIWVSNFSFIAINLALTILNIFYAIGISIVFAISMYFRNFKVFILYVSFLVLGLSIIILFGIKFLVKYYYLCKTNIDI